MLSRPLTINACICSCLVLRSSTKNPKLEFTLLKLFKFSSILCVSSLRFYVSFSLGAMSLLSSLILQSKTVLNLSSSCYRLFKQCIFFSRSTISPSFLVILSLIPLSSAFKFSMSLFCVSITYFQSCLILLIF